jgi:hypothetical protein
MNDTANKPVKLKNGAVVPHSAVIATMMALESLIHKEPILFYELVMKARNDDHRFFGNAAESLKQRALLETNGTLHDITRDVVLSAVEGESVRMKLTSPYA